MKKENMLTKSVEDYLESIFRLTLTGEKVKSVRISEDLGVSKPAVNRAMNLLQEKGFVEKTDYSDIMLTESGRVAAKQIYEKHLLLQKFLMQLGVSEETAEIDCCKMEHVLSEETLNRIKVFVEKNK